MPLANQIVRSHLANHDVWVISHARTRVKNHWVNELALTKINKRNLLFRVPRLFDRDLERERVS